MSDKLLKILGGVLIAMVLLVALIRWNASRPVSTAEAPVDLKSLAGSSIDTIMLTSSEGSVTLTKSSAGWNVGSSPADTGTVAALFKTLKGATFGDLVSNNPANQSQFGLTGPGARSLVFLEGRKRKVALSVGAPADSPGTFYVKVGKNVWTITAQLDTVPTDAGAWTRKATPAPVPAPAPPKTQP